MDRQRGTRRYIFIGLVIAACALGVAALVFAMVVFFQTRPVFGDINDNTDDIRDNDVDIAMNKWDIVSLANRTTLVEQCCADNTAEIAVLNNRVTEVAQNTTTSVGPQGPAGQDGLLLWCDGAPPPQNYLIAWNGTCAYGIDPASFGNGNFSCGAVCADPATEGCCGSVFGAVGQSCTFDTVNASGSGFLVCVNESLVCTSNFCDVDANCTTGELCCNNQCVPLDENNCGTCGNVCTSGLCFEEECVPLTCGNGVIDPGENCDDGNNAPGDMCSPNCLIESGCLVLGEAVGAPTLYSASIALKTQAGSSFVSILACGGGGGGTASDVPPLPDPILFGKGGFAGTPANLTLVPTNFNETITFVSGSGGLPSANGVATFVFGDGISGISLNLAGGSAGDPPDENPATPGEDSLLGTGGVVASPGGNGGLCAGGGGATNPQNNGGFGGPGSMQIQYFGCSQYSYCGNGVLELGEECDEGISGSGTCSPSCLSIPN